ncbi:hypothetical protein D9757_011623 [Collybiopsis confluens]|uniref:TERF2-interacting telomeric protein 1 Myb domain-containing protein n=1 Tax=Collybiopsis confluens TaxID=2823264 RepID=A0A8H5LWR5_9AGAR|nr:hypothetical protein D9757_011623 [Collybiopsis confluens]
MLKPRRGRNAYTARDDRHLVEYLSNFPNSRKGLRLYQDLVEQPDKWPWGARHSWQSWRTRYRDHCERIDKEIVQYLKRKARSERDASASTHHVGPSHSPTDHRTRHENHALIPVIETLAAENPSQESNAFDQLASQTTTETNPTQLNPAPGRADSLNNIGVISPNQSQNLRSPHPPLLDDRGEGPSRLPATPTGKLKVPNDGAVSDSLAEQSTPEGGLDNFPKAVPDSLRLKRQSKPSRALPEHPSHAAVLPIDPPDFVGAHKTLAQSPGKIANIPENLIVDSSPRKNSGLAKLATPTIETVPSLSKTAKPAKPSILANMRFVPINHLKRPRPSDQDDGSTYHATRTLLPQNAGNSERVFTRRPTDGVRGKGQTPDASLVRPNHRPPLSADGGEQFNSPATIPRKNLENPSKSSSADQREGYIIGGLPPFARCDPPSPFEPTAQNENEESDVPEASLVRPRLKRKRLVILSDDEEEGSDRPVAPLEGNTAIDRSLLPAHRGEPKNAVKIASSTALVAPHKDIPAATTEPDDDGDEDEFQEVDRLLLRTSSGSTTSYTSTTENEDAGETRPFGGHSATSVQSAPDTLITALPSTSWVSASDIARMIDLMVRTLSKRYEFPHSYVLQTWKRAGNLEDTEAVLKALHHTASTLLSESGSSTPGNSPSKRRRRHSDDSGSTPTDRSSFGSTRDGATSAPQLSVGSKRPRSPLREFIDVPHSDMVDIDYAGLGSRSPSDQATSNQALQLVPPLPFAFPSHHSLTDGWDLHDEFFVCPHTCRHTLGHARGPPLLKNCFIFPKTSSSIFYDHITAVSYHDECTPECPAYLCRRGNVPKRVPTSLAQTVRGVIQWRRIADAVADGTFSSNPRARLRIPELEWIAKVDEKLLNEHLRRLWHAAPSLPPILDSLYSNGGIGPNHRLLQFQDLPTHLSSDMRPFNEHEAMNGRPAMPNSTVPGPGAVVCGYHGPGAAALPSMPVVETSAMTGVSSSTEFVDKDHPSPRDNPSKTTQDEVPSSTKHTNHSGHRDRTPQGGTLPIMSVSKEDRPPDPRPRQESIDVDMMDDDDSGEFRVRLPSPERHLSRSHGVPRISSEARVRFDRRVHIRFEEVREFEDDAEEDDEDSEEDDTRIGMDDNESFPLSSSGFDDVDVVRAQSSARMHIKLDSTSATPTTSSSSNVEAPMSAEIERVISSAASPAKQNILQTFWKRYGKEFVRSEREPVL